MNCPGCGKPMEEGKFGFSAVSLGQSIWWKDQEKRNERLRIVNPFKPYFEGHLCRECRTLTMRY